MYRWRTYSRRVAVTRKVRRFSGGVYDLGLHVVWCPENRRPVLGGRLAARLDEPIRQKADERGRGIGALEVMPDHVHLFVEHDPKSSASYVANQFKGLTSRVLREHCSMYNGALQERRDAHLHGSKTSIRYRDRSAQLQENRVTRAECTCTACGFTANADHGGATNVLARAGPVLCGVA
ncbi:IS200/IS605 family transposase [Streptomyces sp. NPDC058239]|uniref:IS200/IS605 family transposase n=1 Tax=Streptomyces sp. NPDC058239 TaxID=3346395 RepID=UPI0036EB8FDD